MASWPAIREAIIKRDAGCCVQCGDDTIPLHVHHIKPRWQGGKDNPNNLITLCIACHHELHRQEDKIEAEKKRQYNEDHAKALKQCWNDYMAQGGDPFDLSARGKFERNWLGWPTPDYDL